MKRPDRLKMIGAVLTVLGLICSGCDRVGFSKDEASDVSGGQGVDDPDRTGDGDIDPTITKCTTAINNITYPLKITFLVDASGSNSLETPEQTDPDRNFRYYSIASFLTKFAAKTNFTYQFAHFKGSLAATYINSPLTSIPYFGTNSEMWDALNYFKNSVLDSGRTPYKAAIGASRYVISNSGVDTPDTRHVVIMITDGMPTDYVKIVSDPSGYSIVDYFSDTKTYSVVDEAPILNDVSQLLNTSPGKVTFSTVFYGRNGQYYTAAAKQRLINMAATGKGKFFDASLSQQIHVEDTISVPGLVCTSQ